MPPPSVEPIPAAARNRRRPVTPVSAGAGALDAARVSRAVVHAASVRSDVVILVVTMAGAVPQIRWANAGVERMLGYATTDLVGAPLATLFPDPPAGGLAALLRAERMVTVDLRARTRAGATVDMQVAGVPSSEAGVWTVSGRHEVTEAERRLAEAAAAHDRRVTALADGSPVPTLISEQGLRLAHVNDAFCRLTGRQAEQLLGTGWLAGLDPDDLEQVVGAATRALDGGNCEVRIRLRRGAEDVRDVVLRFVHQQTPGVGSGFLATAEDVTARLAFEARLAHQVTHDDLTGLPNRARLTGYVAERFLPGTRHGLACLFLDVDDFTAVNDALGHAAGDQLLVQTARRLSSVVRPPDLVVRFGGDEFVVVCTDVGEDDAVTLGRRIAAALAEPVQLGGMSVQVGVSVGVTVQTAEHLTADELLQDGDAALAQAKAAGKGRVEVLDQRSRTAARARLQLVADLRAAIERGDLTVVYQPVVSARSRRPSGVEALVRWTHPTRGPIGPDEFIPLAEESGMIDSLGAAVVGQTCRQIARWDAELGPAAPQLVHVNVSALQLDMHLITMVEHWLRRYGVAGERLAVELTESALLQRPDLARAVLDQLRACGMSVAVDDFGTGYSSLAHLRQLPVDCLKIDRSFVAELAEGHPEITGAIIALAAGLGLTSVAEGVETDEQACLLADLGATHLQGYGIARPMTGEAATEWFAERAR